MSASRDSRTSVIHNVRADLRRRLDAWYAVTADCLTEDERLAVTKGVFSNEIGFLSAVSAELDAVSRRGEKAPVSGGDWMRETLGAVHAIRERVRDSIASLEDDDADAVSIFLDDSLARLNKLESRIAGAIPWPEARRSDTVHAARSDLSRKLSEWYASHDLCDEDFLSIVARLLGNEVVALSGGIARDRRDAGDGG